MAVRLNLLACGQKGRHLRVTVLVTGGSGVVGRPLVARLLSEGNTVRALARSPQSSQILTGMGAQVVSGDVLDLKSLVDAMQGTEAVFHVAGVNEMCSPDPSRMYRVNVDGTRNVVRAAASAGVARIVYTSSAVTIGEPAGTIGHETSPHRGYVLSHYERTKTLAEQVIFGESTDVEVVSVNPSSVQGPGRSTGTARLILGVINGELRLMTDSVLSIVDIEDCTDGHLLAWRNGIAGERYILNGFTMTIREALELVEKILGRHLTVRFVPPSVAAIGGSLVGGSFRLIRRTPPVCREMVRVLQHGHRYDGSKAARRLGVRYIDPETTLARTIAWFRSEGLISA